MITFSKSITFCAALFCSFTLQAQTPNLLTLQEAVQLTLQHNPQLAGHKFRVKALQGEQQTAALKPALHLSAEAENIAGTNEFRGIDAGELTLSLSSVIEPGDQRDARLNVVSARQQQLDSRQRLLTFDTLTQLTQQFISLAATQEEIELLQLSRQLAQDNVDTLNRQSRAGRVAEADVLRAKANLARAEITLQKIRQKYQGDRIKLSAFWAETSPTFSQVQANLFALPFSPKLATLIDQMDKNPELAVLGDEVLLQSAQLRQAKAERSTNIEWHAGVRRLQLTDDSAFVLGLNLPLGSSSRAAGAITTARANQAVAEQDRDSTRMALQAQLTSLHGNYEYALAEINALRTKVIPLLEQATHATENAFNQGRYTYLELNLAQRELLDARISLIETAANAQLIHNDIERLTGAAIPPDYLNSKATPPTVQP